MNCHELEKLIPFCAAGELTASEEEQLRTHLPACAKCSQLLETYEQSRELMLGSAAPEFNEFELRAMRLRVLEGIEPRPRIRFGSFAWKTGLGVTAALILVAGTWYGYRKLEPVTLVDMSPRVILPEPPPRERPFPTPNKTHRLVNRRISLKPIEIAGKAEPRVEATPIGMASAGMPDLEKTITERLETVSKTEMLRVELQTQDPNITIIWLTPKEQVGTAGK